MTAVPLERWTRAQRKRQCPDLLVRPNAQRSYLGYTPTVIVAIAFTHVPASQSPNLRSTSDTNALEAYFRALIVTFASVARRSQDELVLVTDAVPVEPFHSQLQKLGVSQLIRPFMHRPPTGFWHEFNASLYTLDALEALCAEYPRREIALIDPDCVAVRPLEILRQRACVSGIAAMPTGFPADEQSNGLSAWEAARLHSRLDPALEGVPVHFGGECYAFDSSAMPIVLDRAEAGWKSALADFRDDRPRFVTEEHIMNYALRYVVVTPLTGEVARIWTAPTFRNLSGLEDRLTLWHLPAEKHRGFPAAYKAAVDCTSWFWTHSDEDFRKRIGKMFGVTSRGPRRWLYDESGSMTRRIQATTKERLLQKI